MNKTYKLYGFLFIILMLILLIFQSTKKENIDWRKNLDPNEKSPFGLFVFNKELSQLFGDTIIRSSESAYQYFQNKKFKPQNILLVNLPTDNESEKTLLNQVRQGSDLMMILHQPYGFALDSIEIGTLNTLNYETKNTLHLTDTLLKKDSLVLDKLPTKTGFYYINKKAQILGYTEAKPKEVGANFLRLKYGKGNIYVHTEPLFITNYYLLKPGNQKYAEDVFSYLPKRETLWLMESSTFQSGSLLRFILQNPALKYAWWIVLFGLIIFVFFNAKRKQRIVPIVEPLKNKSVEFVKSIGNLYLQEGDFHDMMAKKAQYFLYNIRLKYLLDTKNLDEDFATQLQHKTGKSKESIDEAISLLKKANDPYANVMKEDLVRMNHVLDKILQ